MSLSSKSETPICRDPSRSSHCRLHPASSYQHCRMLTLVSIQLLSRERVTPALNHPTLILSIIMHAFSFIFVSVQGSQALALCLSIFVSMGTLPVLLLLRAPCSPQSLVTAPLLPTESRCEVVWLRSCRPTGAGFFPALARWAYGGPSSLTSRGCVLAWWFVVADGSGSGKCVARQWRSPLGLWGGGWRRRTYIFTVFLIFSSYSCGRSLSLSAFSIIGY